MLQIGIGVTFLGYSILYYGFTQVQGGNWGFFDLTIPSRWTPQVAATLRDGQIAPDPLVQLKDLIANQ
jgi:hypothetical protein